jgi:ElaB/YqjD/DUF883 family membrane-anchored ribosome-binding protein
MSESFNTTTRGDRNGELKVSAATVMQDLENLRKDVSRLAGAATTTAREQLGRLGKDVGTRANRSAGYVGEQVRMHPGVALGVALGAGLAIGMLLSASRRSQWARGGTQTHIG